MKKISFKYKGRKCEGNIAEQGDKTTVVLLDGNTVEVFLDNLDWRCNPAPIGFLWCREVIDVSPLAEKIMKKLPQDLAENEQIEWIKNPQYVRVEGPGEAIGIIHTITNQFLPIKKIDNLLVNAPTEEILAALYHNLRPKTFWERLFGGNK
jgi:hypothetical protein